MSASKRNQSDNSRPVRVVAERSSGFLRRVAERISNSWGRLLDLPVLWALLLVIAALVSDPRLAGGLVGRAQGVDEIASMDYVATRELLVLDSETTAARRRQARSEVLPVYDHDTTLEQDLDTSLARLFEAGRGMMEEAEIGGEATRQALADATSLQTDEEAAEVLAEQAFAAGLEDRLRGLVGETFGNGVVANKGALLEYRNRGVVLRDSVSGADRQVIDLFAVLEYPEEVRDYVDAQMRSWPGLGPQNRAVLIAWLVRNLSPNWIPNRAETLRRQEEAAGAVAEAYRQIATGQVIVRRGDRIDAAAAAALAQLAPAGMDMSMARAVAGRILLLGLVVLLLWYALDRVHYPAKGRARLFCEISLLVTAGLLLTRLGLVVADALAMRGGEAPFNSSLGYTYALPAAGLALTGALLYRREIGFLVGIAYAVLFGLTVANARLEMTVYALAGSLAAVFAVERTAFKHRSTLVRLGLVAGVAQVATVLMLLALNSRATSVVETGWFVACALVSGLLAAASASFVLPLLEPLLGITTDLRLVELSNTNLPVLRRLAFEAPGTFQHSMMVANLAKAGSEAIDADSVLAYTAGLYHDIGKTYRPEYFIENQSGDHNRHEGLSPRMSSLILLSHVKDGIKLARRHRLPQPLVDAIQQHHGTRTMSYFYIKAVEQQGDQVADSDYRYPGPRPQSRVMGVLMLADGIEAASRSLHNPSPETLKSVVDTIVDEVVRDGQLDDTELTLADLSRVREAFFQVLSNIFHRRVEYPDFNFDRSGQSGKGAVDDAVKVDVRTE